VATTAARWRSEVEAFVAQTVGVRVLSGGVGLDVEAATLAGYPARAWRFFGRQLLRARA
jgi:hypothetical protein